MLVSDGDCIRFSDEDIHVHETPCHTDTDITSLIKGIAFHRYRSFRHFRKDVFLPVTARFPPGYNQICCMNGRKNAAYLADLVLRRNEPA